jgi:isopenicillin N synthase-like dioxygenase
MNYSIPSVDLNHFVNGTSKQKKQFVNDLGQAYENVGFVSVKNHLLDDQLTEDLYKSTKKFFELPNETKLKYHNPNIAGQRGFIPWGQEHAKGMKEGDLKEFYHFGQPLPEHLKSKFNYPENIFVSEVPEFGDNAVKAFQLLEETGKYMLRAIALYLELDEFYFDDKIQYGNSILRPIHYGPITEEPKNAVRAGQHEDINLITLLMGASAEGLEILDKNNNWVAVTSLPEHLVVNVGDMLQRLTNNKLKSTTHRVVNPPKEKWNQPRFSIPFFLHPISQMSLNCLPNCITNSNPKAYEDITSGEYLDERLQEIGLKKQK